MPTRSSSEHIVEPSLLAAWPLPSISGDKEQTGRVLVIGGSKETPGSVCLAGESALRAGAGKLQILTTETTAPAIGTALPEAMVRGLTETKAGALEPDDLDGIRDLISKAAAVLIGPGMRDSDATKWIFRSIVSSCQSALVVDALALAGLAGAEVGALPETAVLTPNLNELAFALSWDADDVRADPLQAVLRLAGDTGCVVTSGEAMGVTAAPDGQIWIDHTRCDGLAVSGSGDVLAGLVAGLLARGCGPEQAAVWGSHLHRAAGVRLAKRVGAVGFLSRELIGEVPPLMTDLGGQLLS